jgi:hypothetical protein
MTKTPVDPTTLPYRNAVGCMVINRDGRVFGDSANRMLHCAITPRNQLSKFVIRIVC